MQPPTRQDTPMPVQIKPHISRAGLRQVGRLAKLRNECNTTAKLHPEIANDSDLKPLHVSLKIYQILQPITPLTTKEAHHQCSKAIGNIIRKANHMLSDKIRDKESNSYDKSPKCYHNILKIYTVIIPRARDQPRITALTNPITKKLQTISQEAISIVTSHYEQENKGQHQNTYRTLHGHNHITRTTSP